jgi:soluble lytic murein transglycosylase-like protein
MPSTARQCGIDPTNPSQSAKAAAKEFCRLIRHYGGDLTSALSAYNWGEGNLDRKGLAQVPPETLTYAMSVISRLELSDGNAAIPYWIAGIFPTDGLEEWTFQWWVSWLM